MANAFLVLGGIAVGIVTATFGILQVPGWVAAAQDAAAINDLSGIRAVQATAVSETGKYIVDAWDLTAGSNGAKLTMSSGGELVSLRTIQDDWCTTVRSGSGSYIAVSNDQAASGSGQDERTALDAAGCSIAGSVTAVSGVTCPLGKQYLVPKVTNASDESVTMTVTTSAYGSSTPVSIAPGASRSVSINTGVAHVPSTDVSVMAAFSDGRTISVPLTIVKTTSC